jgi:hypothetical protein
MNNRGELANVKEPDAITAEEDPCWDGYTMVGTKTDESGNTVPRCVPDEDVPDAEMAMAEGSNCPDGQVEVNGECVPVEEIEDVPPSSLKNSAPVLQLGSIEDEPIEREELGENKVAYRNLKILESGVWRDSASKQAIWYSPEGLSNMELTEDNAVNIMHDSGNEVSEAGHMENLREEGGSLYADVIVDTSNSAGSYADENMQKTLETEGVKGFGGPSVEIPPESEGGHTTELNAEKGVRELVEGKIEGLGFVSQPASKPTGFDRQASTRGVALSSNQTVMQLEEDSRDMADAETYREVLESNGIDTGEMTDEEVMSVYEDLMDASEGEEMGDYEDDEEEDDEETEMQEDEEEEEEEEMDMEEMDVIQEQIDDLWGEIEELKESMMGEEEMSEELSEAKSELADAETVAELEEAKEELDKRLSELEEEPEDPRSLAEGKSDSWEPVYDDTPSEEASW